MITNVRPKQTYHLQKRDYQRVRKLKKGSTVHCDDGILWVTQAGDRNDYILRPGDAMKVTRRGKVLVEAMHEADFHII